MLTNRSDWPADPAFQAVFEALAPHRVLSAVRERLAVQTQGRDASWAECRAIEALYDPGDHVRIAYALLREEVGAGRRTWPDGDVVYVRYPVRTPVSRRGTVMKTGGFDVEVYRFPNDRRLRGLRRFAGRNVAAEAWQRWLNEDDPALELHADTLRRGLLRYVPEQKWIVRLHGQCYDAIADKDMKRAIAVHSSTVEVCRRIYARTIAMRRVRNRVEGSFRVPRPVALDTDLGLLAIRWIWGDSLLDLLRGSNADEIMRRVATGLHAFHDTPIEELPDSTYADQLAHASRCAEDVVVALPSLKAAVESVVTFLSRTCPDESRRAGTARRCTIHNDFHWNQIRGRADRLTLLDFERCAVGDPLTDVANFTAQLSMLAVRGDVDVSTSEASAWAQAFLDAWESTTGTDVDVARLRWHSAVALLVLARGMMRHLRRGWPKIVEHCVQRAAEASAPRDDLEVLV